MENNSNSGVIYQGKIPNRVKYCFAFGALGKDLIYGMIATFSMIYFTDIIKVAPAFIGSMFFVAKLWDAFNDLFMGMIVDNTRSRWGKFVPWLVIGTLINAFVFITVFTDFHLSGVSLCVFASVVYVLWGMTYTIMDIPYWSIIPNLTSDPEEREKVSVLPRIFASIGQSLIIAGFGVQIIKGLGGNYTGYHRFALIIAATFIFTMAVCVINLPKKQQATGTAEKMKFRDIFTVIKKNDQLRWAVLLILLYNIGIQAIMGVATYYFSYVCNNAGMLSAFMISASVAEVVGLLIFPKVTKLLSRKKAFFGMIDREVFLLCGNKKHDIERITRTIQEASVIIERIFHTKISCGISSSGTSLRALPVLYQQALEALDYNVVIQDESYTYYNDILPLQKDAPLQKDDDWNSEVDSIEKIITHCSEEELKTAVLNMLEHLHEAHYNLNEYQIVILEISFSLARLYKKYQITSDKEFAGSKKMAVKILSLNTGEELDNWLINYFQLMRTLIQKKQVDNNVILAENAKKLVEEHFREPDLSVESICKELHVSSSYFSKIFKQETETTFLNYLISRRMEEAKMLLKMTDYKSHVIGTMVGYPEPNYFSYVFKKHCGISPVKYRKLGGENN